MSRIETRPAGMPRPSREPLGRSVAGTLLLGLALLSISSCTTPPGKAGAAGQTTVVTACSWLEGYPDCGRGHAGETARNSYESAQQTSGF